MIVALIGAEAGSCRIPQEPYMVRNYAEFDIDET